MRFGNRNISSLRCYPVANHLLIISSTPASRSPHKMAPSLQASFPDADNKDRIETQTRAGRHVITDTPMHPTRSLQFLNNLTGKKESKAVPPRPARVKLRIIVVGAGLGGLACAIALARRGHEMIVLEQATELGEVREVR